LRIFQKSVLPHNIRLDTLKVGFTTAPKNCRLNGRNFSAFFPITIENLNSPKKYSLLKCDYGQVKRSFDTPAVNFSTNSPKSFPECPKLKKFLLRKKCFPQIVPADTLNAVLTKQPEFFRQKAEHFFAQSPKMFKKIPNKASFNFFIWPIQMKFWQPRRQFPGKEFKTFRSSSEIDKKIFFNFSSGKKTFLQNVSADTLNAVLTTPLEKFWQIAEYFRLQSENEKKTLSEENLPSICSYGHVKDSFYDSTQSFFDSMPIFFHWMSEIDKKSWVCFRKKINFR